MIDEPWEGVAEEPVPDGGPARERRRRRRGGRGERPAAEAVPRERRRWLAIGLVAASLVAAGIASGATHPPASASAAAPAAAADAGLPVVVGSSARSAEWYCPGPLAVGPGRTSALTLASSAGTPVTGRVTFASSGGGSRAVPVTVAPGASLRVPVPAPTSGSLSWAAASVLLGGGGVAVWQEASGSGGASSVPCEVTTSKAWYIPAGSTAHAADVVISLYDPTATPAVAGVSFSASFGVATGAAISAPRSTAPAAPVLPAVFQGITVAPGRLVLLDVGRQVQLRAELATTVTVTSGRLVVGEWSTAVVDRHPQATLVQAAPAARAQWWFPLADAAEPDLATGYWLYDPASSAAKVTILESLAGGAAISTVLTVPPGTLVPVSLPAAPAPAAGRRRAPPSWALVQAAGGSIVAARGLFVPVGTHGHVAPVGFPQVVLGSPAPAAQWLVRGPVAPPASAKGSQVGGTLTIGAPESTASGARPFIVHVWELGTVPSSGPPRARRRLSVVPITPGTVQQITLPPGASTADWGGLLVLAAKPVFVEVGYAGGGSAGVTSGPNADSMGVPAA